MNPEQNENKLNISLDNLKSDYFLQKFFANINKKKSLEIIKYNKNVQKRLNININNYIIFSKLYSSIKIEIKPITQKYGQFINLL